MLGEIGVFTMVVMIVLIVTIGRTLNERYKTMGRAPIDDGEEAVRLRGEVTRLNERIQVLERLATDPAKRLSDQIDALDERK